MNLVVIALRLVLQLKQEVLAEVTPPGFPNPALLNNSYRSPAGWSSREDSFVERLGKRRRDCVVLWAPIPCAQSSTILKRLTNDTVIGSSRRTAIR
jgi:hypothetical protein